MRLFLTLFLSFSLSTPALAERLIVFFGDSLTAGYGISVDEAYPALIQQRLSSINTDFAVRNAGVSGDTTAAGLRRLEWTLREDPTIFVLALGANDGLRGVDLSETERNLRAIIERVKKRHPEAKVVLAGMDLPTNLGAEYRRSFREMFSRVAQETGSELIPFLLEGVAGIRELNQPDGIHPTAEGQKRIAENVWEVLKPLL